MSTSRQPGFDAAALRETAAGDDALMADLLAIFVRTIPPMVRRLADAIDGALPAQIAQETHDLKGCLALVGATAASAECARIESAARRTGACPPPADATRLCAQLTHIVAQAERHLAATLHRK